MRPGLLSKLLAFSLLPLPRWARVRLMGKVMLGTMHGQEIFSIACPDVSADTALSIADFARTA